ncbi:MAG: hypothetical protein GY701_32895 [Sulfitobacter sp.]|nr:hypothetical protein [Sulfitobacter sp.]
MRLAVQAAALGLMLGLVGCSSGPTASDETVSGDPAVTADTVATPSVPDSTPATSSPDSGECAPVSTAGTGSPAGGPTLSDLLAFIPSEAEYRDVLLFTNVAKFDRDLGVPAPGCDHVMSEYGEYRFNGMAMPPPGLTYAGGPGEVVVAERKAWGLSFLDHGYEVTTGRLSAPLRLRAVDVGESVIVDAVETDPEWSGEVAVVEAGDLWFFQWGDGYSIDFDRRSGARPKGQGGVLAVIDGVVAQTEDPEVMAASLAVAQAGGGLDTDDAFSAVAAELDRLEVHAGSLSERLHTEQVTFGRDPDSDQEPDIPALLDSFPRLRPYRVLGLGWSTDGSRGGVLSMVFATDSPEDAQATVDAMLARTSMELPGIYYPWAKVLELREVVVEGNIATLTFNRQSPVFFSVLEQDLLLLVNG